MLQFATHELDGSYAAGALEEQTSGTKLTDHHVISVFTESTVAYRV